MDYYWSWALFSLVYDMILGDCMQKNNTNIKLVHQTHIKLSHIKNHRTHSSKNVDFIAIKIYLDINQCATSCNAASRTVWAVWDRGWYKCECFRMHHWYMSEDIYKMRLSSKCVGKTIIYISICLSVCCFMICNVCVSGLRIRRLEQSLV